MFGKVLSCEFNKGRHRGSMAWKAFDFESLEGVNEGFSLDEWKALQGIFTLLGVVEGHEGS